MRHSLRLMSALSLLFATLALAACATANVEFIEASKDYDTAELEILLSTKAAPDLEQRKVEDAPGLRREALTELRSQSAAGARAADLITRTFPDVAAVPFHIEWATFQGDDALLLIEAAGDSDGSLSSRRLWAIDDQGEVLISLMR